MFWRSKQLLLFINSQSDCGWPPKATSGNMHVLSQQCIYQKLPTRRGSQTTGGRFPIKDPKNYHPFSSGWSSLPSTRTEFTADLTSGYKHVPFFFFFNAHNVCTPKSLTALSTSCMEQMCSSVVGRGVCVSGQDFPRIHKKSFMSWQHREAETLEGRRKRRGRHLQVCWIVLTSPFRGMDGRSGGGLWTGVVVPEMLLIIH